jgi:hypothetical protein
VKLEKNSSERRGLDRSALEKASKRYAQQEEKYSEIFYTHHLGVLATCQGVNEQVVAAVKHLFLWKFGKIKSHRTKASTPIHVPDLEPRQFYALRPSDHLRSTVEKATNPALLTSAISFRDGKLSFQEFKDLSEKITKRPESIVSPIFFLHIWNPEKYPMIDRRAWKTCCRQRGVGVSRSTQPRTWEHYKTYKKFVEGLVRQTGLDLRTIDRALWVLDKERSPKPSRRSRKVHKEGDPMVILKRRLARGEISEEEYVRKKKLLNE